MKYIVIMGVLLFNIVIGCGQNTKNRVKEIEHTQKECKGDTFFLLEKDTFRQMFLSKVDSLLNIQYPNNRDENNLDVTNEVLFDFLKDIDKEKFLSTNNFEKSYNKDNNKYKNHKYTIMITFYPSECGYRLVINHFIESDEWVDEVSVIYSFSILDDRIVDFVRQEAG